MADVYANQKTVWKGSFSSDTAALSLGKDVTLGIVQNAQITFSQQVARIYDVSNGGTSGQGVPVYYVGGRTNGQVTIARILGPSGVSASNFYEKMGKVCTPQDMTFTFAASCDSGSTGSTTYTVEKAVMVNVGISVASQDMIINENVSLMFANLKVDSGGGKVAAAGRAILNAVQDLIN